MERLKDLAHQWEHECLDELDEYDEDTLMYCGEELRRVLRVIESENVLRRIYEEKSNIFHCNSAPKFLHQIAKTV